MNRYIKFLYLLIFIFHINTLFGQSLKKEKMENLSYMVGEWVGTSTLYKGGKVSQQVPAFEKISYDLNKSIIVIELNTELLQLHTIIYFSEDDDTYYYNPFSQNGARKLPASFTDGKFVVNASETKRFIFERTKDNGFREYGEELIKGKWVKYFEDVFMNTK